MPEGLEDLQRVYVSRLGSTAFDDPEAIPCPGDGGETHFERGITDNPEARRIGSERVTLYFNRPFDGDCETLDGDRRSLIDALSDAGVKVGLSRHVALRLAAQTVLGSAKLLLETGAHPGYLKDQVTSPGGTAIAGLHTLEAGGLRTTLIDAVEAATKRARELGLALLTEGDST